MKKFAFIGAGSLHFTTSCMRDLLTFDAFKDAEFALIMDINKKNLDNIKMVCEQIKETMECPNCKIIATMDRKTALENADGVLCTVFNGDVDIWRYDIEIPKKYGIDINVGDTRSVSGIFRALQEIYRLCSKCVRISRSIVQMQIFFELLQNPMPMLCGAMQKYSNVEVTGLWP